MRMGRSPRRSPASRTVPFGTQPQPHPGPTRGKAWRSTPRRSGPGRAYWERRDEGTRREIAAISDEITAPADDPVRLRVLGLIDPIGRGKQVVEQVARLSPVGMSDPDQLFAVGVAASSVWADTLAL